MGKKKKKSGGVYLPTRYLPVLALLGAIGCPGLAITAIAAYKLSKD